MADFYGIKPETYKGIYAMHKYWSKKPFNLVGNYIDRYSHPEDIVLDAFCGSGVTAIEAVKRGRRAVAIDINPIAIFNTEMGLQHIDILKLKRAFSELKSHFETVLDDLYQTHCSVCDYDHAIATHTIWENGQPIEIWVACSKCKTSKTIKSASEQDRQFIEKLPEPQKWYPHQSLIENPRINAKVGMQVADLFTKRALTALSILLDAIYAIDDEKIRDAMLFCFSATLPQTSKMVFVIRRRGKNNDKQEEKSRSEVGSWVIGYWVPSEHFEIHVWRCFENRFKRILKGKQEVNEIIPSVEHHLGFDKLQSTKSGYWISKGTATKLNIPNETVDYIFTDPPHGNRIPYLELSLMWNSWLKYESDWDNEIIISEAKSRAKRIDDYHTRIEQAFAEFWRVLKPNKYLSVAFNSLDDETWLSILNTCFKVGFELIEVIPLEYSARSVVQDNRKNALKTDFVITLKRVLHQSISEIQLNSSRIEIENLIWTYIASQNKAETYSIINHLLITSTSKGELFSISTILEVLESRFLFESGFWVNQ